MTTYIIINSIITLFIVLFCVYLFSLHKKISNRQIENSISNTKNEFESIQLDWIIYLLLGLAFILVLVSFFSPFIFTRQLATSEFDFSNTGEIGDTIGGLMNPFVAIAGVIVTGLAFYIQYKANLQQRALFLLEQEENKKQLQEQINQQNRQIQIQQFESQFYEMLKLHRENISEMKINGYDFEEGRSLKKFEKITESRKIFVTMKTEFECILSICLDNKKLNDEKYKKCYNIFFLGLDSFEKLYSEDTVLIEQLRMARNQHEYPDENPKHNKITTNEERKDFSGVQLKFNYKPFSGHSSRLGHYFRHLYLTVKSIANSSVITDYEEKMKYLRILRAQLSNHEQILLFYNWLGEFGNDWENEKHSFFTEYKMIHNLPYHSLFDDPFIQDKVNNLRTKEVKLRKGKMFEID